MCQSLYTSILNCGCDHCYFRHCSYYDAYCGRCSINLFYVCTECGLHDSHAKSRIPCSSLPNPTFNSPTSQHPKIPLNPLKFSLILLSKERDRMKNNLWGLWYPLLSDAAIVALCCRCCDFQTHQKEWCSHQPQLHILATLELQNTMTMRGRVSSVTRHYITSMLSL